MKGNTVTQFNHCPNCNAELKGGIFSKRTELVGPITTKIINEYRKDKAEGYCTDCVDETDYLVKFKDDRKKLADKIQSEISAVPIISTHTPLHWDYKILGIVTGQSTTGTGVFAEIGSSFTDFFGQQSTVYNQKIKAGEDICFAQLRKYTLDLGGNAVIAVDIDYSELGALKGMIMVCMTGTAIKLRNLDVLGKATAEQLEKVVTLNMKYSRLMEYRV